MLVALVTAHNQLSCNQILSEEEEEEEEEVVELVPVSDEMRPVNVGSLNNSVAALVLLILHLVTRD